MRPLSPPGRGALARVRSLCERTLTSEEIRAALALPLGVAEEEDARDR
jgi:hypothetical protein